jgi:hypothetical protein
MDFETTAARSEVEESEKKKLQTTTTKKNRHYYEQRFIETLVQKCNDGDVKNYKYAGGSKKGSRHANYFALMKRNDPSLLEPHHESNCACSHPIEENCFIQHKPSKVLIVVGNCCIENYLDKQQQKRTCAECDTPHKNRKLIIVISTR